jgi:hypothetical protein
LCFALDEENHSECWRRKICCVLEKEDCSECSRKKTAVSVG